MVGRRASRSASALGPDMASREIELAVSKLGKPESLASESPRSRSEEEQQLVETPGSSKKDRHLSTLWLHTYGSETILNSSLAISVSLGYCLNYCYRYPIFMMPDDISKQTAMTLFGVDMTFQEALTVIYCVGFGLAKLPAVYVMSSSFYFGHRLKVLWLLVLCSSFWMTVPVALSSGEPSVTLVGVFLGCFPSSMLYGGLISYVEGRRSTELLVAALHFAGTFASSSSRGLATAFLASGVEACWMPVTMASVATPVILAALWVLEHLPPPSVADIAARQPRQAMSAEQRSAFVGSLKPGLVLLLVAYSMVTALRFFRDLFSRDILTAANGGEVPSPMVFTLADLPAALVAACILLLFLKVDDSGRALHLMFWAMVCSIAVACFSTWLFHLRVIGCMCWQMTLGAGLYGMYSIACMPIYDRLVSAANPGNSGVTCTFLVFYGDLAGYAATVTLTLWKTFLSSGSAPEKALEQFMCAIALLGTGIIMSLLAAQRYFSWKLKDLARLVKT